MLRRILTWIAAVIAGVVLGLGSAWAVLEFSGRSFTEHSGRWVFSRAAGSTAAGPYTRAIIAREGLLALSAREAVYFSLYTDEHDRPLSESCVDELNGQRLDARWWSLTLYADDNYLARNSDNAHSIDATRAGNDAPWMARISPVRGEAASWLSSREARRGFVTTALPIVTFPDVPVVVPLAMSINVLPGLDMLGNTVPMTWTVTNVPEASHILAGLRACNIVFSIGPAFVGGIDLGLILNVPASPSGCNGYLFTADAFVDVTTVNGTGICSTAPISFGPPPSRIGAVVTTQAIAIAPPGVYNGNVNDINGGGSNSLWTSNAIQQTYNPL